MSAQKLIEHLRTAKVEANWDLGDICLSQCGRVVQQLSDKKYTRRQTDSNDANTITRQLCLPESHVSSDVAGSQTTNTNQLASTYGMDTEIRPARVNPISDDGIMAQTFSGEGAQHDASMLESWDPFSQLTIPDLWDTTDLDKYTDFPT